MTKTPAKKPMVRAVPKHRADARKVRYGGGMAPAALARAQVRAKQR